jgi:hypothetical protein
LHLWVTPRIGPLREVYPERVNRARTGGNQDISAL